MTFKGLDTNLSCERHAACIKEAGYQFVLRYYSYGEGEKVLKPPEAKALSGKGILLGVVFEFHNNQLKWFSAEFGSKDAERALELAGQIKQPAGSTIFFAVDFDCTAGDANGPILDYFTAVKRKLDNYKLGVYGSGLACRTLREAELATCTWLSGSTRWSEYDEFSSQASVVQIRGETRICDGQLEIDEDTAESLKFGLFRI